MLWGSNSNCTLSHHSFRWKMSPQLYKELIFKQIVTSCTLLYFRLAGTACAVNITGKGWETDNFSTKESFFYNRIKNNMVELGEFCVAWKTSTVERGNKYIYIYRFLINRKVFGFFHLQKSAEFISWHSIAVLFWIPVQTCLRKTRSTSPRSHFPQLTKQQKKPILLQSNAFRKYTKLYQVWSFSIFQKAKKKEKSGILGPNRRRREGDGLVLHGTEMRVLFLVSVVLFSPSAASARHSLSEQNSLALSPARLRNVASFTNP